MDVDYLVQVSTRVDVCYHVKTVFRFLLFTLLFVAFKRQNCYCSDMFVKCMRNESELDHKSWLVA